MSLQSNVVRNDVTQYVAIVPVSNWSLKKESPICRIVFDNVDNSISLNRNNKRSLDQSEANRLTLQADVSVFVIEIV
jgi:DNA/RNA-binding domain of Phe-tRNA-synthetase-like protein